MKDPGPEDIWPPTRHLDGVARDVAKDWDLELGPRYPWARHSFTAPAGEAVLKISPPEDDEADHEPDALEAWAGDGAVRLLRRDRGRRAMLIERAVPGHDATRLPENEALAVALAVGARIWRRIAGGPFRTAHERVAGWLASVRGTGHRYVPVAERVFAGIDQRDRVLVHGDLHHYNLLRHGDRWVVIDPKPVIAEPEFDVVTLLWNPLTFAPTRPGVDARIRALAATGLDERRIRDWAIVRGVYLGLPLKPDEDERTVRQLSVVRCLVEDRD